jgi:hypothetical protein
MGDDGYGGGGSMVRRELMLWTAAVVAVVLGAGGSFQLLGMAASRSRATVLVGRIQIHAPLFVEAVFTSLDGPRQSLITSW